MDNAAFEDPIELPRILKKTAEFADVLNAGDCINLLDNNGNKVGFIRMEED
jgi:hypothetical protein